MKFLGQHIYDLISRFRNDVYLENISSGTIASGGNLGLDSNNKIVKAAEVGSSVDLTSEVTGTLPVANGGTGATSLTDNKFLLGNGTSAVEASSHFTYYNPDVNQDYIQIGDSSTTLSGIITNNAAPLSIQVDFPIGQTDAAGGDITFIAGASTGTATAGSFKFRSSPNTGSSGTALNAQSEIASLDNAGNLQLDGGITTGSTSFVNSSGVIQVATQGTIDHDSLANFVAAEHYRWDTDISSTATIHTNNITDLHGAGVDGSTSQILTDDGDGTVTSNAALTFSGEVLLIGDDDDGIAQIKRRPHNDDAGGDLYVRGGDATNGITDKAGGNLQLFGGRATGNGTGGGVIIQAGETNASSGTALRGANTIASFRADGDTLLTGNLIFEGPTPDVNETTFSITDPTADRTITVPDASGTMAFLDSDITGNAATATALTSGDKTISGNLTVSSGTSGDATLIIEADTDNNNEDDGPRLWFKADGDIIEGAIQQNDNTFDIISNVSANGGIRFLTGTTNNTGTTDPSTGATERMRIIPSGNVGIGVDDPTAMLEIFSNATTQLKLSNNADDFASFTIGANGNTTITTVDAAAAAAHFEVAADGNITLDAAGDIALESAGGTVTVDGALQPNTIELGHASDTTLARSAAGTVTIEGNTIVTTAGSSAAISTGTVDVPMTTFQLRKTLSTADMNSLHTTDVILHPGAGANKLVIPIGGVMRVDRAATNTNSPSLNIHYSGVSGTYGSSSIVHFRRFMQNITTDAVFSLTPNALGNRHLENLTSDLDNKLVISSDGAFTTDCFTSVDIFLTYQIIQIA